MKRHIALLLALWLLIFTIPAAADISPSVTLAPLPGYTLRPIDDEIIVFAAANGKANIVGYITQDNQQSVHVLGISDNWCYISFTSAYGMSYGYLPLSYFDAVISQPTATPEAVHAHESGTTAWVLNSAEGFRLNLREESSVTAKSLGKYYTGTPVTLTGEVQDGYAQVLLADMILGWLDMRFLTTDASMLVPETPMVTVQKPGGGATLRSGPAATYDRLGWYEHGTLVTVLGVRSDGWYHVTADGLTGFMAEGLLSGTFPYNYGTDSDNPVLSNTNSNDEALFYINTRSATSQLNLRKEAASSSKSLGLFYTGTPLTVISYTRTGWAYVRIGHTEGYVDADYLTATPPTRFGMNYIVRNSRASGLNLRSLPSTGGEVLGFADNYSPVIVLGELSDGWCYVSFNGTLGYMLGTGLEKSK